MNQKNEHETLTNIREDVEKLEEITEITEESREEQLKSPNLENNNNEITINLIKNGIEEAQDTYEAKTYEKMTKSKLIDEYTKVCNEKNQTKISDNKLKKTTKGDIIKMIKNMKGESKNTDIKKNNKISHITSQAKKSMAKNMYNMNLMATYAAEKIYTPYSNKTGIDIRGLAQDLAQPKEEKIQIPIFESIIDQYPEFSKYIGNCWLQYTTYMGSRTIQRASHNTNHKLPDVRQSKPNRSSNIPKNPVLQSKNIPNNKKSNKKDIPEWITLRSGKVIRNPMLVNVPLM